MYVLITLTPNFKKMGFRSDLLNWLNKEHHNLFTLSVQLAPHNLKITWINAHLTLTAFLIIKFYAWKHLINGDYYYDYESIIDYYLLEKCAMHLTKFHDILFIGGLPQWELHQSQFL